MKAKVGGHEIYLEVGKRKVLAGAVHWPGWCRFGADEASAVQALLEVAPRYQKIMARRGLGFTAPGDQAELEIIERLQGNATTDFGAPAMPVVSDAKPVGAEDQARLVSILKACWEAFDEEVESASGRTLRKGPRGGGRDLDAIVEHVISADESYLKRVSWKIDALADDDLRVRLDRLRAEILQAFGAACRAELPTAGPRGGKRWSPRYFVRRVAYHVVDHTWEIEDRVE